MEAILATWFERDWSRYSVREQKEIVDELHNAASGEHISAVIGIMNKAKNPTVVYKGLKCRKNIGHELCTQCTTPSVTDIIALVPAKDHPGFEVVICEKCIDERLEKQSPSEV